MFSSDNFPTHSITYRAELPSTTLTTDLVHLEKRLTGTLRQCAATALTNPVPFTPLHPTPPPPCRTSSHKNRVQAAWANSFLVLRQGDPNGPPEPHSVESIKDLLRRGALPDGARVMIQRGGSGKPPVFFKFNKAPPTEISGAHIVRSVHLHMLLHS